MPFPLVWAVVVVVTALGAAGAAAAAVSEKRIAMVGPRKSGKSTLADCLAENPFSEEYQTTTTPRKEKERISLTLKISVSDFSGNPTAWAQWRDEAKNAELICFLVPRPLLSDPGDALEDWEFDPEEWWSLAERAAKQVGSWELHGSTALIVTHQDKNPPETAEETYALDRTRLLRRLLGPGPTYRANLADRHDRELLRQQLLGLVS